MLLLLRWDFITVFSVTYLNVGVLLVRCVVVLLSQLEVDSRRSLPRKVSVKTALRLSDTGIATVFR